MLNRSNSSARSKAAAMCRHSQTFGSRPLSSEYPVGAAEIEMGASLLESAVAISVTSNPRRNETFGEKGGKLLPRPVMTRGGVLQEMGASTATRRSAAAGTGWRIAADDSPGRGGQFSQPDRSSTFDTDAERALTLNPRERYLSRLTVKRTPVEVVARRAKTGSRRRADYNWVLVLRVTW